MLNCSADCWLQYVQDDDEDVYAAAAAAAAADDISHWSSCCGKLNFRTELCYITRSRSRANLTL